MSSLSPKDRVSLCSFTFADGRRCRTPRISSHPHFCFYHAQKEARARTAETLGKDLSYFFSGDYLSACDLSTALARLIPAVVRGDVKPKTAHTVAYLVQTLMQAIHLSQHEYCEAFSSDVWRKSVRNSVNGNYNYRFPLAPEPAQSESPQSQPQPGQTSVNCHSSLATQHSPLPHASQPAPSPHTSLPPTSAEFVQQVVAGLQTGGAQAPQPAPATFPTSVSAPPPRPGSAPSPPSATQPTPSSQLPNARPATSPIQSSPAGQHSGQEAPEPLRPFAAAPSASLQKPRPAAGAQTGPSGLPVLAPLPPRKLEAPSGSRSS